MFFYVSLFKSRCGLKQSLFRGFTLFLQKKVAVFLVFMTFSFFLIWLSIKKRRIPGLNIG
nr:MAG TPA: Lymphocyte activation family X [Caudoviricetes sp.]